MIIDKLQNADAYCALHPGFATAFEVLRDPGLAGRDAGPAEIDGKRLTINVIKGELKPEDQVKMECHRKYIDIQYVISGNEAFSWSPTDECHTPVEAFNAEADFGLFDDSPCGWFPLLEGTFAVFFPEDAHGPMRGEGAVHKIVVKVAVDWE